MKMTVGNFENICRLSFFYSWNADFQASSIVCVGEFVISHQWPALSLLRGTSWDRGDNVAQVPRSPTSPTKRHTSRVIEAKPQLAIRLVIR